MKQSLKLLSIAMLSTLPATVLADNGQLLASQCYQCHGPNGNSKGKIDSISGESASEMYNELIEMKNKQKVEIMHKQVKAYTDAELLEIANYLANPNN